jgi:hypothetical protein
MTKKLFNCFYEIGKIFIETGKFDEKIVKKLAKLERFNKFYILFTPIFLKISNFYWDNMLKRNNVLERRDDKPFVE